MVENDVLVGLDIVVARLDGALGSLGDLRRGYNRPTVAIDDRVYLSRQEVHQRVLSALENTSPSAGNLRLVSALFHVTQSVLRMTEQCEMLGTLLPSLAERLAPDDGLRKQIERIGELTRAQVVGAKTAFRTRDLKVIERLFRRDAEVKRAGRKVFERALDGHHDDRTRGAALLMLVALRCFEELDDNAVEVAEQAEFVSTGRS